jgi:hypothetical protein
VAASLKRGLPLLVVVLGLAVMASPALAAQTHVLEAEVGGGELTAPAGLAIGPSGDLYVADPGASTVRRYDSSGAPAPFAATGEDMLGTFVLPATGVQVAVDDTGGPNAGDIYVIDRAAIRAFKPNGEPAPFSASAPYVSGNRITGSPSEPFTGPRSVAVDSNGDIYVADFFSAHVYTPTGEALTEFFSFESNQFGVDPAGVVYAGSTQGEGLEALEATPYPVTTATSYGSVPITATFGNSLGVDSGNGQLYVGGTSVRQYAGQAAGGALLGEFGSEQLAGGSAAGLAVDRSSGPDAGDVYVSAGGQVDRFGPSLTAPDVVTGPATAVDSTARTATLNGTVDPNGVEVTDCEFEYGLTTAYGQTAECAGGAAAVGDGATPEPVSAEVTGLAPGNYHFRLAASNADAGSKGSDQTFTIVGPPVVEGESAEPGRTEVELVATINPGNLQTTYRFEYGATAAYGSNTGTATLPAGTAPTRAALGVVGLQPGTTYHFRVVVGNSSGTVVGPDATFATETGSAAGGCPLNEALRIGPSALLPECRAYEMVSPPEKNGGRVYAGYQFQAAASGNAIEFLSTASFAGAEANTLNAYVGARSDGGWATSAIDAPQYNSSVILELTSLASSEDLGKTLQFSLRAAAPGAVEGDVNLYLRDNATGARTLIAAYPKTRESLEEVDFNGAQIYAGGTPDWSRLFLTTKAVLTPDAVAGQANNYEYANGQLRLVTLSPEGQPAVPAAIAAIGANGQRVVLQNPSDSTLYVVDTGKNPVPIASQRAATAGQPASVNVGTVRASRDISVVYFFSSEALTEDASTSGAPALYRYEVASGSLTDLTPIANPELETLVAVSEDGSRFYVEARGALEPGSQRAPGGTTHLFAWHEGAFSLVATTDPAVQESGGFPQLQASPDGRFIGIGTFSPLTGADVTSPACPTDPSINNPPEFCRDAYLYEAESKDLTCVSCKGAGAGFSSLGAEDQKAAIGHQVARAVLNDGTVLFDSPNKLVPRDANGVGDVYEWRAGRPSLVSTGADASESTFADATADGQNIFFRTSQKLVGQDADAVSDLYDARVNGGIAAQNPLASPPACEGQECRGTASSPPPALASSVREGMCEAFGGRARKAREKAKHLATKAGAASGKNAKKLRRQAAKQRKRAKQLNKKADQCRRQGK